MPNKHRGFSVVRFLFWLIGLAISVAILIPVAFLLFFNPNDYKSQISTLIDKKTGLPLAIEGDITVHYFPWLGFHAQKLTLQQPSGFGDGKFIDAAEMEFKIPIKALWEGKLDIQGLQLSGLKIHLIQNADGSSNWNAYSNQLKRSLQNPKPVQVTPSSDDKDEDKPKKSLSFALTEFDIKDASITFDDVAQHQTIALSHLQLKGKEQGEGAFNIDTDFDLALKGETANLDGHGKLQGTLAPKNTEIANFSTRFNLDAKDYPQAWRKVDVSSQVIVNDKAVLIKKLNLKSANQADGEVTIPFATGAAIKFNLNIDDIDIAQLPKAAPKKASASNTSVTSKKIVKTATSSAQASKARKIEGDVRIQRLKANDLTLSNIKAHIIKDNHLLKISPLTAQLYQGHLSTQITKDLHNEQVPVWIQGTINQLDLKSLLLALKKEARLSGKTDLDFSLQYLNNPQGVVKCRVNQGVLEGIDVKYYLMMAHALLKKEKNQAVDSKATPFESLTATLRLHDNIIDNNDLLIKSPDFKATGEGSINLGEQSVAYKMQVLRLYQDGKEHKNTLPLALRIKGPLNRPKVEPDLDVYLKTRVKDEVNKQINKQLDKQLHKHLGKLLGADKQTDAPPTEDGATQEEAKKDPRDELIDKAIKKGLDKLFK